MSLQIQLPYENFLKKQEINKVNFRNIVTNTTTSNLATHYIHRYPAKLIPHIPRFFLSSDYFSSSGDYVLDPFCGTGTVPLESIIHGRNAVGIEINPVSALIAKVKTHSLSIKKLEESKQSLLKDISKSNAKPDFPEMPNINHWFRKKTQNDLTKIKYHIDDSNFSRPIKNFFLVSFSATVRKVSNADPRINQPVYSKKMKREKLSPKNTMKVFRDELDNNILKMNNLNHLKSKNTTSKIICSDIKNSKIDKKFQLIITSPPYLMAHEYLRSTSLEFSWLGFQKKMNINELKKQSLGIEGLRTAERSEIITLDIESIDKNIKKISKFSKLRAFQMSRYFADMQLILKKLKPRLRSDGYFVLIIGNNRLCNTIIPMDKHIKTLCEETGFEVNFELIDKIKTHGLMTKRNNTSSMINSEKVIIMKKM